jgi:mono/diheme cytochrome c family protein
VGYPPSPSSKRRFLGYNQKVSKTHLERRMFMRKLVWVAFVALGLAFSGTVLAADGSAIFKKICSTCHGPEGEGRPMMAPALKGNKFIIDGDDAAITEVIKKGRMGNAKKYKDIPVPMMPQNLKDEEIKAVIQHIRGLAGS